MIENSGSASSGTTNGLSKAEFEADVIDEIFRDLVVGCTREKVVRNYFDIAVVGEGDHRAGTALCGSFSQGLMRRPMDLHSACPQNQCGNYFVETYQGVLSAMFSFLNEKFSH